MAKICAALQDKTGFQLNTKNAHFFVSPFLTVVFSTDEISAKINSQDFLILKNLNVIAPPLKINNSIVTADYISLKLQSNSNSHKKSSKSNFDFSKKLPEVFVKNADIDYMDVFSAHFDNIYLKNNRLGFNMNLNSKYLKENISIKNLNKINIDSKGIYTNGLDLNFKNSIAHLNGGILYNKFDLNIKGKNLPVYDIEELFIRFKKQTSTKKTFIENFKDFSGTLDVDLKLKNNEISGYVIANNLSACTVPLNVPMKFEKTVFKFENNSIYMDTNGILGGEKVNWNFYLTDIAKENMEISGSVRANLTNEFAKKYIPGLFIEGFAVLNVDYLVHNKIVDVLYSAEIPLNSDIVYNGARLGLDEYIRSVHASTNKDGDVITLTNYDYSVKIDDIQQQIIYGNAKFVKQNGKYRLDKITGKTKKDSPVSLLGFIENRLSGGFFNGDFEYDFSKNRLLGSLILQNSRFKNFKIENAAVFSDDKILSILAQGTFNNEIFSCELDLKNQLKKQLYIYNLDLFLKKYQMQKNTTDLQVNKMPAQMHFENPPQVNVEKFSLRLDEFKRNKIEIKNILLTGNVTNNILQFKMPYTQFAQGQLTAKGFLNYDESYISADFSALDIDADTAASQIFNLGNHFTGKTAAKLHLEGPLNLNQIKGSGSFKINQGALLNIGNTEFVVKSAKRKRPFRFSLSDIIKIDDSIAKSKNSNITGKFDIFNKQIKNANLFVQNDTFSVYIEGDYNIQSGYSLLDIWGRYDSKIEHKISIFHIPLGWCLKFLFKIEQAKNSCIEKLLKIPSLETPDTKEFNIRLEGNVNNLKQLKTTFKKIN